LKIQNVSQKPEKRAQKKGKTTKEKKGTEKFREGGGLKWYLLKTRPIPKDPEIQSK